MKRLANPIEEDVLGALRALDGRSKAFIHRLAVTQAEANPATPKRACRLAASNLRSRPPVGAPGTSDDQRLTLVREIQ